MYVFSQTKRGRVTVPFNFVYVGEYSTAISLVDIINHQCVAYCLTIGCRSRNGDTWYLCSIHNNHDEHLHPLLYHRKNYDGAKYSWCKISKACLQSDPPPWKHKSIAIYFSKTMTGKASQSSTTRLLLGSLSHYLGISFACLSFLCRAKFY